MAKYWGNVNSVRGVKQVLNNINRRDKAMKAGAERGLKLAGAHLLAKSQRLVPVDSGNLKASGFVRTKGSGYKTDVNVGYTAFYAIYVHENLEMKLKGQPRPGGKGNFWDPAGRGQSKFLEFAARTEGSVMREIIKMSIKGGKRR